MSHTTIFTEDAVPPLPVFSQATVANGVVYCSGNIGCDKDFKPIGGIEEQTQHALENLAKVLKAAGSSLNSIVKANIYLVDMKRDFDPMNKVYIKYFTTGPPPARTCVGVSTLPMGALMEIECTALVEN